jgi:hypothetical protein
MRIKVKSDDGKKINLIFPTWFVFSDLGARIAAKVISRNAEPHEFNLSGKDLSRLMAELRKIKKKYGRFELVDVQSAEGDTVKIVL